MPEETELRQSAKDAIPDRRSPPWAHNGQTCPVPPPHAEQMSPPAVVGGCFALGVPLHTPAAPPFVLPGDTMLVNASSAIFLAVTALAPSTVWIPSFVCESVPDAARAAGAHARFYAVDEGLTPDSSRLWPASAWQPGRQPESFDKQFVRDHLERVRWDKTSPPPALPPEVVAGTARRYEDFLRIVTEKDQP